VKPALLDSNAQLTHNNEVLGQINSALERRVAEMSDNARQAAAQNRQVHCV
jgi:hypothetical protein